MPLIRMTQHRADDAANTLADTSPDDRFRLSAVLFRSLDRKIVSRISRQRSYALPVNQISCS